MVGNTDPEHTDVLADLAESEKYRLLLFCPLPPRRSSTTATNSHHGRGARRRRDRLLVSRLVNQTPMDGIPLSERDFNSSAVSVAGNEDHPPHPSPI
jgi:hypothetical protein